MQSALGQNIGTKQGISHEQTDTSLLLVRYNQEFLETVAVGRDVWHFNLILCLSLFRFFYPKPYI